MAKNQKNRRPNSPVRTLADKKGEAQKKSLSAEVPSSDAEISEQVTTENVIDSGEHPSENIEINDADTPKDASPEQIVDDIFSDNEDKGASPETEISVPEENKENPEAIINEELNLDETDQTVSNDTEINFEDADTRKDEENEEEVQPIIDFDQTYNYSYSSDTELNLEEKEIINNLDSCNSYSSYMASIQPMGKKNIEDTMDLESFEERLRAFTSPDFLLEADAYYENKKNRTEQDDENQEELKLLITNKLKTLSLEDITPSNAYAYLLLAEKIKDDTDLYNQVQKQIAEALLNYDQEHFGNLSAEQLEENYTKASEELSTLADNTASFEKRLDEYEFSDNKKEQEALKQDFLNLAKEMAAVELAKTPLPEDERQKADLLTKTLNEKLDLLLYDTDPDKRQFTAEESIARLATHQTLLEETKNRSAQKFGENSFTEALSQNLDNLDKRFTKKYGKKYQTAKKYTMMLGKIATSVAKSTAMFTVAGMIPPPGVGTAALIAYNTAKQWKGMKKQLTDPSISRAKKTAILLGAGVTTALSALSVGTGLNSAVQAFGLDSPATAQAAANMASTLGVYGRLSLSTVANTIPNWVEKYVLNRKEKRLKNALSEEADAQKRQEISKQLESIQAKKQKNKEELIGKTIGATLGTAIAASGIPQKMFASTPENTENAENSEQPQAHENENKTGARETALRTEASETRTESPETRTEASETKTETPETDGKTQPDKILGKESPDAEQKAPVTEQKAAANLEAAKAENSGHGTRSAYASAHADLENQQNNLNLSEDQIRTTSENMSKIYGTQAYMATHAALAEPRLVASAMGLDNIHTSAELLNYMQSHDCSNNEGLKTYISEHFDSNQRFHFTNASVNTQTPHTPAEQTPSEHTQEENTAPKQKTGLGFKFERVDRVPVSEHHAPASRQETPNQTETPRSTVVHHNPAEHVVSSAPYGSEAWLKAHGWVYDPQLSNGLNRLGADDGSHNGYRGAYYKADDPSKVMFMPNDPIHDKPEFADRGNVKASQSAGTSQYYHGNHDRYGYGCPDEKINHIYGATRVLYGTGVITQNSGVDKVINTVEHGAVATHQILDVIHHAKHIFR